MHSFDFDLSSLEPPYALTGEVCRRARPGSGHEAQFPIPTNAAGPERPGP